MLRFIHDINTLELSPATADSDSTIPAGEDPSLRWTTDDTNFNPHWELERTATGNLNLQNHESGSQALWVDTDNRLHVQSLSVESDTIDADTLDGHPSTDFVETSDIAAESATASGDGSSTSFTITHSLGSLPASVTVTPTSEDAMADHYLSNITDSDVTITYAGAPPSGTDNLSWNLTAVAP